MTSLEEARRVAQYTACYATEPGVMVPQTRFRLCLASLWEIPVGARLLEIGSGQGDMTAALADTIGETGHITAVDIAARDYGAPINVGDATDHLKTTPLGPRIDFHFECDLLDPARDFPADHFDGVVLAHCSWYFTSRDQLRDLLLRVRPWARRLYFSEWDMEPRAMDQVGHLLAVLITGQIEAFKTESRRNIRTPLSRPQLKALLQETGWEICSESTVDSSEMQDGVWEIDNCLEFRPAEAERLRLPGKTRDLLTGQLDILRAVSAAGHRQTLSSYAVIADRVAPPDPQHH